MIESWRDQRRPPVGALRYAALTIDDSAGGRVRAVRAEGFPTADGRLRPPVDAFRPVLAPLVGGQQKGVAAIGVRQHAKDDRLFRVK